MKFFGRTKTKSYTKILNNFESEKKYNLKFDRILSSFFSAATLRILSSTRSSTQGFNFSLVLVSVFLCIYFELLSQKMHFVPLLEELFKHGRFLQFSSTSTSFFFIHLPFLYNSRNTYATVMKLCPSESNLVTNILKSKWPHHVTFKHAQSAHN